MSNKSEIKDDAVAVGRVFFLTGNCSLPQTPLFDPNNGSDQVITDSLYFCKCLLASAGLLLNLLSIRAFLAYKTRNLFITMIFSLSVCEICFNASGLIFELFFLLTAATNGHVLPIGASATAAALACYAICQCVWIVYKCSLMCRNWLIVLIAWRRYRAIAGSLSTQRGTHRRQLRTWLVCSVCAALLLTVPRSFELAYFICAESRQIVQLRPAAFSRTRLYSMYMKLYFALTSPLPIASLVLISVLMMCHLRRTDSEFEQVSARSSRIAQQRRSQSDTVTQTVLVLCGTFILCELPLLVAGIAKDFECGSRCHQLQVFIGIANILTSLDSVANFIVYLLSIHSFRAQLVPCWRTAQANAGSGSSRFVRQPASQSAPSNVAE